MCNAFLGEVEHIQVKYWERFLAYSLCPHKASEKYLSSQVS